MRDTIDMAREAGFDLDGMANMLYTARGNHAQLERFAALVAAAEREACAKVCEDMAKGYEERNARPEENRDINPEVARIASMTCAFVEDAIRARGNA
jgi:hypothetical protein